MLTETSPSTSDHLTPTVTLTPEQIAFYRQEGYLVLPPITTPEETEWLRTIYDALFERRAGREDGLQFDLGGADEDGKAAVLPQILNPARYAPELATGLFRANAMSIAKQLLGETAIGTGDHAIFKPARIGAETPWHQDESYWNGAMDYDSFSLWMPLQPATPANGCMEFIPRSHTLEVVPHQSINNDPRIHGLETVQKPDTRDVVQCPLPAGGCTIHHNRTLHYAGANRSEMPRRAYIMTFGVPPQARKSPRTFAWQHEKRTAGQARAKAVMATTQS